MPHLRDAPSQPRGNARAPRTIRLYGWDSQSGTWHGPNELCSSAGPDKRLLHALRAAPGSSWFGSVSCGSAKSSSRFFALVHDLSDCAVASIYCDESKAGPAEIIAVIPAKRRAVLREEFAFEFLAYARFLGSLSAGAELQVHEAIMAALAEEQDSRAIVFSICSGLWPSDLDPILSSCVEKVATTMSEWLDRMYCN